MRPPDHTSFLLDRAVHYTVRDGLPHDDVQALAVDSQGRLWVTTAAGTADCDLQAAVQTLRVQTLREIPLDQVNWGARNGRRQDLPRSPLPDRFGAAQSAVALRPGEHGLLRWNGNPYRLDAPGDGLAEGDGVLYLLPYWLGRYLGLIAPASAEQQDHDAA